MQSDFGGDSEAVGEVKRALTPGPSPMLGRGVRSGGAGISGSGARGARATCPYR